MPPTEGITSEPGVDNPLRDASIGDLMKQLAADTAQLVRQEIELAKAETAEKGRKAGPGLGMFGGAGLLALLAAGTFTATVIAAIAEATPVWLAAAIVTVVYLAIAGILAIVGRDKVKEALPPVPEQTIETVKEDVAWAKTQMKSARK
jgi:uncharacterized membrane protein YqjE